MNVKLVFSILLLAALSAGQVHGQARQDGVTVYIYDVEGSLNQLPAIVAGQTPNVSRDEPLVDFSGGWEPPEGSGDPFIDSSYAGLVWGWIELPVTGTYEFRLTSDDGSKFFFNRERNYHPVTSPDGGMPGSLLVDNDNPGPSSATGSLSSIAGSYPFTIEFYQNDLAASLRLEWKKPGDSEFSLVPTANLETELDQTHVSSPGTKLWFYPGTVGGAVGGPGDGRPLAGVHPGFDLEDIRPPGFDPPIGGIAFMPDGRMVICTWEADGCVYFLDNYGDGDPNTTTITKFAEGLGEPLGLLVHEGEIHVTQKQELTKLVDVDGDGWCDEYIAVSHGWPMSFNYHEFTFNLVEKDGFFWFATSVPLRSGSTAYSPQTLPADGGAHYSTPDGPGGLWKVDPASGEFTRVARGLRTPNGMGIGPDGELFGSDNQGDWLPSSRIDHLREGAFYGHQETSGGNEPYDRPALWLEHGRISNSPTEPILVPGGPYAGQILFGDVTHGGIKRACLEVVNGVYQGCAFRFSQGLEVGINRLAWGPDGALYAGGLGSGGNWNHNGTRYGIQRLRPNGQGTFEMLEMKSRADGFEITFTEPVPVQVLANPANYQLVRWRNDPSQGYGAGRGVNQTGLNVAAVAVSSDRRRVHLTVPGLEADRVVYLRLKDFINDDGVAPWSTEAWYTLNEISTETGPSFTPIPTPPPGSGGTVSFEAEEAAVVGGSVQSSQTGYSGAGYVTFSDAVVYEAENATLNGVTVETNHQGFTGSGYVDFANPSGDFIEWTIHAPAAGNHLLRIRHAFGASGRPLDIRVNGDLFASGYVFPNTGGWASWKFENFANVPLVAGANTVRLSATGSSGGNFDSLTLVLGTTGGGSIEWTFEVPEAKDYLLSFRYASGAAETRTLDVSANGGPATAVDFPVTGGWGVWNTAGTTLPLTAGQNTVRLENAGGGVNVDRLEIVVGASGPGAPEGAIVLFDGAGTGEWEHVDGRQPVTWPINTGGELEALRSGADIRTTRKFTDYQLHLEWLAPAGGSGQRGANSGVKLHERYELQILNTGPELPIESYPDNLAGSIYAFKAPDSNASLGAGAWQSFDIWFTAPRWSGNQKLGNAEMTVFWNGELVHNAVEVPMHTGASPPEIPGPQSILLQVHGHDAEGPVRFRNIWVLPTLDLPQGYAEWAAANGLFGDDADPGADTDGDGITQLWEYISNGNPNSGEAESNGEPLRPRLAIGAEWPDVDAMTMTYRRRTDHAVLGLKFELLFSDNLGWWSPLESAEISITPSIDGVTEHVTVEFTPPSVDRGFFRMSAGLPGAP